MDSVTDISQLVQAEEDALEQAALSEQLAKTRAEANQVSIRSRIEAEEAKKSMEKYIDITSHEMRNPLSAILQSADGMKTSILDFMASSKSSVKIDELVASAQEACKIITLCAQHQGRIVNDVLTLSKLNSTMMNVSPVCTQPSTVIRETLEIFEGDFASNAIEYSFLVEQSYKTAMVDWAMLDPYRVTQILVNLTTNAIKFTRLEEKRVITVFITKPPHFQGASLQWFPSSKADLKKDPTLRADWGQGKPVFLFFAVQDTGRGLDQEERMRLFNRFAQANTLTHVTYGGSGIGLLISREITELHGGEIGLYSEKSKGSTFAFYVKGRKTAAPEGTIQKHTGPQNEEIKLPLAKVPRLDPSARAISSPSLPSVTKTTKSRPGKDPSSYEVLLVGDNLVNQKVLAQQLRKAGCIVHVANHGVGALDVIEHSKSWSLNNSGHHLDVVIMDLKMPIMDGLTCARHIRELQNEGTINEYLPIIAVTANARKEQIETSIAAGMDHVMPKPFKIAELLAKMEKMKGQCRSVAD